MRKGSTPLGSLGVISKEIVLLILPLSAVAAGALLAPTPSRATEEVTPPAHRASPATPESAAPARELAAAPSRTPSGSIARAGDPQAVREAVERRRAWLATKGVVPRYVAARRSPRADARILRVIQTRATWYGPGFHGRRTASGERFNQYAMTLASRHLPFGTRVRVVNPRTGRSALARVNDRGPYTRGYTADLSKGLAQRIGLRSSGPVRLEILSPASRKR